MNIGKSNLVQYNGIEEIRTIRVENFNQMNIAFNFDINENKASIKEIIKVSIKSKIVKSKIVNTQRALSVEGQKLTGKKMIVLGDLQYKVEYISNTKAEDVCTAKGLIPFSGYIALPSYIRENNGIAKSSTIEDIYSEVICERKVYNNIILTLRADIY